MSSSSGEPSKHLDRLHVVPSRLQQANLKLNPKKCQFFNQSVSFLGHTVSGDGIKTDKSKVSWVANWPTPVNVHELRSFTGLTYYRRFVQGFSQIAAPFRLMEKEKQFQWTEECESTFKTLQRKLVTSPVLGYPRRNGTFYLDTDASYQGIRAVLAQGQDGVERVLAYGSCSRTKSERNYCTTRMELLALIYFMRHFRPYLIGQSFVARTDHSALQWVQNIKEPEGQRARWIEQMQEYDFTVEHRRGRQHQNADTLTQVPCCQFGLVHFPSQTPQANALIPVRFWVPAIPKQELWEAQEQDHSGETAPMVRERAYLTIAGGNPRRESRAANAVDTMEPN